MLKEVDVETLLPVVFVADGFSRFPGWQESLPALEKKVKLSRSYPLISLHAALNVGVYDLHLQNTCGAELVAGKNNYPH